MNRDLELVEIIYALKVWRHYVLSRKFTFMTDHGGLKNLFDQPRLKFGKAIWLAIISEFYFEIKYIKGKENKVIDALKRMLQLYDITTIRSYKIDVGSPKFHLLLPTFPSFYPHSVTLKRHNPTLSNHFHHYMGLSLLVSKSLILSIISEFMIKS